MPPVRRTPGEASAISIRHLSKRFGGATALDDVALDILPGEVHGLLGQNGSGKSTLIKILSGYHAPEPGAELVMYGEGVPLPIPAATGRRLGLAFVHQHLGLVPSLSVLENLRMGEIAAEDRWYVNWRRERERARAAFARFGLAIDPEMRIADLPPVERALVAIVRAFEEIRAASGGHAGVLVLDEPTPFLPKLGVEQLFALVRAIVREGAAVIFVSHDVDEIMEITDRATVLRDGKVAGTLVSQGATHGDFVELIVGRRVELFHSGHRDLAQAGIAATVGHVTSATVHDVSLEIRRGEVLGLTGLIGSGFDELPYLLYGARTAQSGSLAIGGATLALDAMSPPVAMAAGMALLPSDRLGAAGVGGLPVADNITLPVLDSFFRHLLLNWQAIFARAAQLSTSYDVRPNRPEMNLASLSGGNQQKALMAKWLQTEPALLLLDEPTQGVDVGARQHLFGALNEAAERGTAVLVASTDYEQLSQLCDRVLIFARGRIIAELSGAQITKGHIAEQCLRSTGLTVGSPDTVQQEVGSP